MPTVKTVEKIINYLKMDVVYNQLGNRKDNDIVLREFIDYNELTCIFDNGSFLIEYDKRNKEFVLSTSFSNQVVTLVFVNCMNILVKTVNALNKILYENR